MKFGKKIFIMSFIIVVISIYIIGFILLSNNYKTRLQEQIDKSIFQINTIYNNFILYENEKGITVIANQYMQDKIHVEVNSDGKLIYSNIKEEDKYINQKIKSNDDANINIYIENGVLYTDLRKNGIEIFMTTDISKINEDRTEQIEFFIKLTILFSSIIALILSILVSLLTKKIKKLNHMAQEIQKGNYEIKVSKLGTDEVGNLGKTFNEMAESIENNIKQINKTAEDRKDFINNLTHEIRTPLTSIIGYSSLIKDQRVADTEKIQEYSNKIYNEGTYIKEITDKLMEMILLESQRNEFKEINISEALETIISELQQKFPNANITKSIEKNVWAKADFILLKTLVDNLVKNSIKAYETEDIFVNIILKNNTIEIIDFGKGIQEEEIEKILQPFYTQRKDRNREFSGMGLGLPLCIKIVETFKWKFRIESKIKKGTKIILRIGENNEEI